MLNATRVMPNEVRHLGSATAPLMNAEMLRWRSP